MTDSFFQKVYDIIQPTLPEEWEKIVLYAAFMQESCEIKYFVKEFAKTKFRDCFEIVDNHIFLFGILSDLQNIISAERSTIEKEDQWKFATITIDSEGNFETFYDYSENFWTDLNYGNIWSRKYLR